MFSQSLPAFPASELSGFFAVPSVASASAFVGIEGTAKNRGFQSCSVSTTATNRHNCLTPDTQLTPKY